MKRHCLLDKGITRFVIIGIFNTLLGTAIMLGLYNLAGCTYWISSAANYIICSILSYFLNKRFTFGYRGDTLKSGLRFAVNIALCYLAAYGAAKPFMVWVMDGWPSNIQENAAMLTGMCIFTGLNYLGQKFFVFGEKDMDYREEYSRWLKSAHLSVEEKEILEKMSDEEIRDAFYRRLEFGTAGMRGVMGLGTNRINRYTIRMASKGLAETLGRGARVVIAYDTRKDSPYFAKEAARVLAAAGIDAMIFDRYSPVPLLSFAVRDLKCDGGIVITASHNIKEYNGFKVYDSTGCQICSGPAKAIEDSISHIDDKLGIDAADIEDRHISYIGQEVVDRFMKAVLKCGDLGDDDTEDLRVVYTPLHGSGREYVMEALKTAGFHDIILIREQSDYNGEFPTVRKPNPEDPAVFAIAEKRAMDEDADIIIGTDPDSDRIGVGVRHDGRIVYLSGNQTGTLLVDFICRNREAAGKKLITSIVTGDMGPTVAESHGAGVIRTYTGFKNLGEAMNMLDEDDILMAYEESFGYLTGTHIRDKDGISTALVVCRMAAYWKKKGATLIDALEELYGIYGYHIDDQSSFVKKGEEGARKISSVMERLRKDRGKTFDGIADVRRMLDYSEGIEGLEPDNVLKYIMDNGSWLAVRPSGTEPKIKFYYCIKGEDRKNAEELHMKLKKCIADMMESIG